MLGIFLTSSVKGATLTEAEYARLKLVFSDLRIATMSDEDASRYLSYDLENTKKVSKYYRVTKTTNGTTTTEVSEEEATSATENIATRGATYTTTYKNIHISTTPSNISNTYFIDLTTLWLKSPYIKSYGNRHKD